MRYRPGILIRESPISRMYKALDYKTGDYVAIKVTCVEDYTTVLPRFEKIIAIIEKLDHPNIVKLVDYYIKENDYVNMIPLLHQMLLVVQEIHRMRIVHRDIRPENVLISGNGLLKITGFDMAHELDVLNQAPECEVAVFCYRSIELLLKNARHNVHVDMWSVGCIIVEMTYGEVLWPGANKDQQIAMINEAIDYGMQSYVSERMGDVPIFLLEMASGCLEEVVHNRLRAQRCIDTLQSAQI